VRVRKSLLYFLCAPVNVVSWGVILFMRVCWGRSLGWEEGCLTCTLREGSWPVRTWYSRVVFNDVRVPRRGTTLGHAIFYGPSSRGDIGEGWTPTQAHEHVHVRQFEGSMAAGFFMGALAFLISRELLVFGLLWVTGHFSMLLSNWFVAWLRGVPVFRDSVHEDHAYAAGELYQLGRRGCL
jgi:hypothetical protein